MEQKIKMGLWKKFVKSMDLNPVEDIEKEYEPEEDQGWIEVRFSFYLDGNIPRKEIAKECKELIEIFMNGQSFINEEGEYLGYGNPKINKNVSFLTYGSVKKFHSKPLSKLFIPQIVGNKIIKGRWHIICKPAGDNSKYKIKQLHEDMFILWNIDKDLRERYGIGSGVEASADIKMIKGNPKLIRKENLMIIEYNVEERIKYKNIGNKITDKIFGGSLSEQIGYIKTGKSLRKITKKEEQDKNNWIKAVDKLLEKK